MFWSFRLAVSLLHGAEEHPPQDTGLGSQHGPVAGELGPLLALQGEVSEISVLRNVGHQGVGRESQLLSRDGMELLKFSTAVYS